MESLHRERRSSCWWKCSNNRRSDLKKRNCSLNLRLVLKLCDYCSPIIFRFRACELYSLSEWDDLRTLCLGGMILKWEKQLEKTGYIFDWFRMHIQIRDFYRIGNEPGHKTSSNWWTWSVIFMVSVSLFSQIQKLNLFTMLLLSFRITDQTLFSCTVVEFEVFTELWHHVGLVRTEISKECITIFKKEIICAWEQC